MKAFTPSSSKMYYVLFFLTFLIGQHHDKAQPPACNYLDFFYDAKKLLQADNCIIITSD